MSESIEIPTKIPPGPEGHFLHGNAADFHAGRLRFLERMVATYGDVVRYRLGCDWYYLIRDPQLARRAFTDWERLDNAFTNGWLYLDQSFLAVHGRPRAKPRSVVHGSICPRTLFAQHRAMRACVEDKASEWKPGETRDVFGDMRALSVEMLSQALFGRDAHECLARVFSFLTDIELITGAYVTEEEEKRFDFDHRRAAFVLLDEVVTELVATLRTDDPSAMAPAFAALLAGEGEVFPARGVVHELCVLLLSNTSTGVLATWMWYVLATRPEIRETLQRELDDVLAGGPLEPEHLPRLQYLDALVKETLRFYPPIALVPRRVLADWPCGEFVAPTRSRLHISPYLMHRHPEYWAEPQRFAPERFFPDSPLHREAQSTAYMPFGYGIRHCIGDQFGVIQAKIMIATLAARFGLELPEGYVVAYDLTPTGAMWPTAVELPMIVHPRSVPATEFEARQESA